MSLPKTLPIEKESLAGLNAPSARRSAEGNVLVVNRDPEIRILLHRALSIGNFSSTSVSSSEEAMTCLSKGDHIAVIVSVESPESMKVIETLCASSRTVPVFAFSRAATPELVRDVMRVKVADFIFGSGYFLWAH